MRVAGFRSVGGPEVLRLDEAPVPRPGPGQVLIRVAFAGVNFAEVMARRGDLGEFEGLTVPGLEASGWVAELGDGVDGLRVGEPVAALTHMWAGGSGGYAEFAVAPATLVYPVGDLDLRVAAAVPCVVSTAYGLLSTARLAEGETVLIHAATGGVGSTAARIARALGAGRVLGTVGSPAKIAVAERFGYDAVFLRDEFPAKVADHSVDIVLDAVGGPTRQASLDVLAALGRLVVFGNAGDFADEPASTHRLWHEAKSVIGYSIGELAIRAPEAVRRQSLAALELVADGRIEPEIAEVLPLAEAARAHQRLESGDVLGKLLLAVA